MRDAGKVEAAKVEIAPLGLGRLIVSSMALNSSIAAAWCLAGSNGGETAVAAILEQQCGCVCEQYRVEGSSIPRPKGEAWKHESETTVRLSG
jgi:hypothetical protein